LKTAFSSCTATRLTLLESCMGVFNSRRFSRLATTAIS